MNSRRSHRSRLALFSGAVLLVAVLALAAACGDGSSTEVPGATAPPPPTAPLSLPERVRVKIGDLVIDAEAARTIDERAQGLSDRASLADGTGMLFFLGSERIPGFHMRAMRFPLDFIWISSELRVADLTENVPFPSGPADEPERPQPEVPVLYVLEVNAGVIAESGAAIGDPVVIEGVDGASDAIGEPEDACGAADPVTARSAESNAFANGGFEDGADPWISLTTSAWGTPFTVSDRQAQRGEQSALLELRSELGGSARVFGVVQEISPDELPQTLSGYYCVESWLKGTPVQYLQFVVIVFDAENVPEEFAGVVSNHQVRYILAGVDSQPTFISNARYVMLTEDEPKIGEWVYFERDVRQDFQDLWGDVPAGFSKLRVLFEVRWDERKAGDGPSSADVFYDDLYFGTAP